MKVATGVVIGIDTKTVRLAAAVSPGPDEAPVMHVYEIPKNIDFPAKCHHAEDWVHELVRHYAASGQQVFVFVEEPLLGRGVKASIQCAKIEGACLSGASKVALKPVRNQGPVHVFEVNVQTWKKAVVGAGNARKGAVAGWIAKYWRQAYERVYDLSGTELDQDLVDASAVCFYGMKTVNLQNKLYPVRRTHAREYLTLARERARDKRKKPVKKAPTRRAPSRGSTENDEGSSEGI